MKKLEYTFKTDTLFKMLFVQHQDLLKAFVTVLLGYPLRASNHFLSRILRFSRKTWEISFAG